MSIVTKQGDEGKTRLFSGEWISKGAARIEAYGTVDELVSVMGLARSICKDKEIGEHLFDEQKALFKLGSELATKKKPKIRLDPIDSEDVERVENRIYAYESTTPITKEFVIPGKNLLSSALDMCRTTCRRLERRIMTLVDEGEFSNSDALIYVNRLSDLLFIMARKEEK